MECPICLQDICEHDNVMHMPVCGHVIHVSCELQNVQYDLRCPICRTQDPTLHCVVSDSTNDTHTAEINEEIYRVNHMDYLRIIARENRFIRKNSPLRNMRDTYKETKKKLDVLEKGLEKKWNQKVKDVWQLDPEIVNMRKERQRLMRLKRNQYKRFSEHLYESYYIQNT